MTKSLLSLLLAFPFALFAQKQIYIPQEWQQPNGLDYSLDRSAQSDNFIVFWGPLAGNDPTQAPSDIDFDPQNILNTAEELYDFYIDGLQFVPDDTGLLSEYKIILVMLHTWTGVEGWAFGGNYDGTVGAMWMHPDAASSGPTLAHEFTHTLQNYAWMMYPGHGFINHSYVGFFWEAHAEFMALQRYNSVALEFDMARWLNTNQFHWSSTRHHYQAFIFLQFIKELDGLEMINRLWRESNIGEHPLETYKRLKGINQSELNDLFGQYAMRNVTWDYEIGSLLRERQSTLPDIFVAHATIEPEAVDTATGWYRISDHLAPQDYGYNIIRLFPEQDGDCRTVHLKFRGHANADEAGAGWRYGFVAVKNGDEARYSALYEGTDEVSFKMNEDETELYLVVTGAPTVHHNYDWEIGFPKIYRFPYEFRIEKAKPDGFQPGYRAAPNVAGAPHANGGGFVAATATVAATAYVGPHAQVLDNAQVLDQARIEDYAIVKHNASIRENAIVSGSAIVGEGAQVFGAAQVREQARVYGNSALQGNAVVEGNAMIHFTQVADDAVLGDNVFCYNANLHGDVRLGGDAEFFSECSDGTYLQFVEAYGRNCDGLDDHPANVEVNAPYEAFTAAAMQYDLTLNCNSLLLAVDTELNVHICAGDTYDFNGEMLSSPGQYQAIFTDVNGGDSLVTLNLMVHFSTLTNLHIVICNGDSYQVGEEIFTQTGAYQTVLTSSFGCDSLVHLVLSVEMNLDDVEIAATICGGDTYSFNGEELAESGVYTAVHPSSANGCDSTTILTLTVLEPSLTLLEESICAGQSYTFDGAELTESGAYTAAFTNAIGCDSIVVLNLSVQPPLESSLEATICGGDTYDFNGETLTESGIYTNLLSNQNGCDSIITLTLTVLEPSITLLEESICNGASYTFDGEELTEAGAYTAIYSNALGCDSVVILNLSVMPFLESAFEISICEGDSYDFHGDTLTESGVYTTILTTLNGCDSTVTLTLQTIEPSLLLLEENICNGQSYPFNGEDLTETGAYTAVYTQANGCDSIVVLNLTVLPTSGTTTEATICPGEAYLFNGEVFTEAGVYVTVLSNTVGCDSIVVLDLSVSAAFDTTLTATICEGDTYTFIGQELSEAGTYTATITNEDGCNGIITLELSVQSAFSEIEATICAGETYLFQDEELTEAGNYTVLLTSSLGCDSIVVLTLSVLEPEFTVVNEDILLTVLAEDATFQWVDCTTNEIIEGATESVFSGPVGSYAVMVTQNGCTTTSECYDLIIISTDELPTHSRWVIMPNPTSGLAQLRTEIATTEALDLQVFDIAGRLCLQQNIAVGELAATIDLSNFSDGVFLIRLTTGQFTTYLQRLVKVTK